MSADTPRWRGFFRWWEGRLLVDFLTKCLYSLLIRDRNVATSSQGRTSGVLKAFWVAVAIAAVAPFPASAQTVAKTAPAKKPATASPAKKKATPQAPNRWQ